MKKIFLLTIIASFTTCCDDIETNNGMLGPIRDLSIRLVDTEGNWIEGIEEKEMQLFVADSNWNILEPQPENYNPWSSNPFYLWGIKKEYNYVGNGKGEFVGGKKELLRIYVGAAFRNDTKYRYRYRDIIDDETFGDYVVLQIDENTSLNIQLFYKEFSNYMDTCIEKPVVHFKLD